MQTGICDQCSEPVPIVPGVTVIWDRGHWWCAKHVTIDSYHKGEAVVASPSDGKLSSVSIVTERER